MRFKISFRSPEKYEDKPNILKQLTHRKTRKISLRNSLLELRGQRRSYVGTFQGYGMAKSTRKPKVTMLIEDIVYLDIEELVTDHIWFTQTDHMMIKNLKPGERVSFTGIVKKYKKIIKASPGKIYIYYDYRLGIVREFQRLKGRAKDIYKETLKRQSEMG